MKQARTEPSPSIRLHAEVIRAVRVHARSSMKEEICGILIGRLSGETATVHASIMGAEAAQGGAHVTFTQDTWEHIYAVKDRDYPDDKILGWYHSHPGFGVFLSEHDTFIQQNFFSAPHQIAWVFDPHSDEEGCFGWREGRIERLGNFAVVDGRGGEPAGGEPEQSSRRHNNAPRETGQASEAGQSKTETASLEAFTLKFLALFTAAVVGFALAWFVFPRVMVLPVPVDPKTGIPLVDFRSPGGDSLNRRIPPADKKGNPGNGTR